MRYKDSDRANTDWMRGIFSAAAELMIYSASSVVIVGYESTTFSPGSHMSCRIKATSSTHGLGVPPRETRHSPSVAIATDCVAFVKFISLCVSKNTRVHVFCYCVCMFKLGLATFEPQSNNSSHIIRRMERELHYRSFEMLLSLCSLQIFNFLALVSSVAGRYGMCIKHSRGLVGKKKCGWKICGWLAAI